MASLREEQEKLTAPQDVLREEEGHSRDVDELFAAQMVENALEQRKKLYAALTLQSVKELIPWPRVIPWFHPLGIGELKEEIQASSSPIRALEKIDYGLATTPRTLELLRELNTSISQLEQNWINAHLPKAEIAEIKELAVRVFDDEKVAVGWLTEANIATDNKPPIELLGTSDGFERVKNLLLRIQFGVLA